MLDLTVLDLVVYRKQNLLFAELKKMRTVKVSFNDHRISTMEDFIGRGDRRVAAVLKRAWEVRNRDGARYM